MNLSNSKGIIKFMEKQMKQQHGILSDGDPKFDSGAVQDFSNHASIEWNIISAYNLRGKARVESMTGILKRVIRKVVISNRNRERDNCLGEKLGRYRIGPDTDGK